MKGIGFVIARALSKVITGARIFIYYILSDNKVSVGCFRQPVLSKGRGEILIEKDVELGVEPSPFFFSSYTYLEARDKGATISIGENTKCNNSLTVIAYNADISIGNYCLIGASVSIVNSDFHDIKPCNRFDPKEVKSKDVVIENNVFIGNGVSILKGVTIGKNSVIASGAVVTKSFPNNSIVAGNPASLVGKL
ncbi:acyltransferase [Photobacterium sagamiensis]|uniref:acyltransferase n=1 Tax=Photobacterium sagamiensis TaxID=2910241 RepID=UPI003D1345DC